MVLSRLLMLSIFGAITSIQVVNAQESSTRTLPATKVPVKSSVAPSPSPSSTGKEATDDENSENTKSENNDTSPVVMVLRVPGQPDRKVMVIKQVKFGDGRNVTEVRDINNGEVIYVEAPKPKSEVASASIAAQAAPAPVVSTAKSPLPPPKPVPVPNAIYAKSAWQPIEKPATKTPATPTPSLFSALTQPSGISKNDSAVKAVSVTPAVEKSVASVSPVLPASPVSTVTTKPTPQVSLATALSQQAQTAKTTVSSSVSNMADKAVTSANSATATIPKTIALPTVTTPTAVQTIPTVIPTVIPPVVPTVIPTVVATPKPATPAISTSSVASAPVIGLNRSNLNDAAVVNKPLVFPAISKPVEQFMPAVAPFPSAADILNKANQVANKEVPVPKISEKAIVNSSLKKIVVPEIVDSKVDENLPKAKNRGVDPLLGNHKPAQETMFSKLKAPDVAATSTTASSNTVAGNSAVAKGPKPLFGKPAEAKVEPVTVVVEANTAKPDVANSKPTSLFGGSKPAPQPATVLTIAPVIPVPVNDKPTETAGVAVINTKVAPPAAMPAALPPGAVGVAGQKLEIEFPEGVVPVEFRMREELSPSIKALQSSIRPTSRIDAITALAEGRYGNYEEVKWVIAYSAKDDPANIVRIHCIECLSKLGFCDTEYVKFLTDCKQDKDINVRMAAIAALGKLAPK